MFEKLRRIFENMFNNIGGKIKTLAKVLTVIGMILSIIWGIVETEFSVETGFAIIALGCLFSWVGSFLLYGFGELIDNTKEIANNMF